MSQSYIAAITAFGQLDSLVRQLRIDGCHIQAEQHGPYVYGVWVIIDADKIEYIRKMVIKHAPDAQMSITII